MQFFQIRFPKFKEFFCCFTFVKIFGGYSRNQLKLQNWTFAALNPPPQVRFGVRRFKDKFLNAPLSETFFLVEILIETKLGWIPRNINPGSGDIAGSFLYMD